MRRRRGTKGGNITRENEGDKVAEWNIMLVLYITGGRCVVHMQKVFMCMNIDWVRFIISFDAAVNRMLD